MNKLIHRVPSFVFVLLFFGPLIYIFFLPHNRFNPNLNLLLFSVSAVTMLLWQISVIIYMKHESGQQKNISLALSLAFSLFSMEFVEILVQTKIWLVLIPRYVLEIGILSSQLILGILMTSLIKTVFYARSTWFLFLEVWIAPMGIITLTPDIQAWEKSDKK